MKSSIGGLVLLALLAGAGCAPFATPAPTDSLTHADASCVDCDGDDNVPFFTDDAPSAGGTADSGETPWTVMVYFATHVGSDSDLAASVRANLAAMRAVGAGSFAKVAIEYHRPETGTVAGAEDVRLELAPGPIDSSSPDPTDGMKVVGRLGDEDTGSPQTLSDFIRWAMTTYPAQHYALILHGHGLAWQGFGWDSNHGDDHMTLAQLTGALGTGQGGARLDLIMFDACLMGTVEVAAELAPYTRYLLASEDVEIAAGQPYGDLLPYLTEHPEMSTEHIVANVAHAYVEYYSATHGYAGPPPSTSLTEVGLDLDALGGLEDKLGAVATALRRSPAAGLSARQVGTILAGKEMAIADDGIHSADLVQVLSGIETAPFTDGPTRQAAHAALAFIGYPDDGYSAAERSVVVHGAAPGTVVFGENGWARADDVTGSMPPLTPSYVANSLGAQAAPPGALFDGVALAADPGAPAQLIYTFRPFIPNALEFDWVVDGVAGSVKHERDYYITQSFRARSPGSPFIVEAHTQGYYFKHSEMVHGLGIFFGTTLPTFGAYSAGRFGSATGWPCIFKTLAACSIP